MKAKASGADKQAAAQQEKPKRPDLVAEVEAQLGEKLVQARADFQENQSERTRLDGRRAELVGRQDGVKADHRQRLIDHGKGVKGAAEKRAAAEQELATINQELEAVDAAIAFEAERTGALQVALAEMEGKLGEARKRQVQMEIADALTAKKEEFVETFKDACIQLHELVVLADKLMAVDGAAFRDQALEDLILRTSRVILIDQYKFSNPQSNSGLAHRIFEVSALVPPPEPAA